jgi:hypothetical protein
VGAVAAFYCQPYVKENSDALLIVTTVFTVFAGFLVAIITILGDPSLVPDGTWRAAESRRENIEHRIIWHIWLFVLYLSTIGLIFISAVVKKAPDDVVSLDWKVWIDRAYLFVGVSSFLLSFALPFAMRKIQMDRLDREIERRRRRDGIQS